MKSVELDIILMYFISVHGLCYPFLFVWKFLNIAFWLSYHGTELRMLETLVDYKHHTE